MPLTDYQKKRNFQATPEPSGTLHPKQPKHIFVIQKHDATRLHFDFRLEADGVLKSWAVPKGPSLDPTVKRLAMMVEDHPYSYRDFEGHIPEGNYGAGEVIVWDTGTYTLDRLESGADFDKTMLQEIAKGEIKFTLHGQKVQGSFALVKVNYGKANSWLLIKHRDEFAATDGEYAQESVKSGHLLATDEGDEADEKPDAEAKVDDFPEPFSPMLATLIDKPFTDKNWLYEQKLDGYRSLAMIHKGKVELYSRNHVLLNNRFPQIVKELEKIPVDTVLDGEIVGKNEAGKITFQALQNGQQNEKADLAYHVFDITYLHGKDLKNLPLTERKKLLKLLLSKMKLKNVLVTKDFADGVELFKKAAATDEEGIIAKRTDSHYLVGMRSENWVKIKTSKVQEAIICGYTEPKGSRHDIGALILGVYDNGELTYVGHTGTGFSAQQLHELQLQLTKVQSSTSPFAKPPKPNAPVTWLKPVTVCEIKFSEWTEDKIMRQPVFLRLRDDKPASSITFETPEPTKVAVKNAGQEKIEQPQLTHLDKVYWPEPKFTKKDLLDYYDRMADLMLPYLQHRPESLHRFPNGAAEPGFFQKNITNDVPDYVDTIEIESDVGKTKYLICNNKQTLLYMGNLGCLEINPWNSRIESLDCPDYLVIDLDPEALDFSAVMKVAQTVKKVLDQGKVKAFCKTSGKRGMHIFIPLHGQYETDLATNFAHLIATLVHQELSDITSLERSPQNRQGKVYLDFLQNNMGQTLASVYSPRPAADATVSTPLDWSELSKKLDPKNFTLKTVPARVEKEGDIWSDLLKSKNNLREALKNLS